MAITFDRSQPPGVEGKHRDAIAVLTTFEAVNQYNYFSGWPAVEG